MRKCCCLIIFSLCSLIVSAQKEIPVPLPDDNMLICGNHGEPATFPGGNTAWLNYIRKNNRLDNIYQELSEPVFTWTAQVTFIINTKGRVAVSEITTGIPVHPRFLAELRRLFAQSPLWIPEKLHGRPIKSQRKQPVVFVTDEKPKRADGTE